MIGKVAARGEKVYGLLAYLFGPGRNSEHASPHLAASWGGDTAHLEPPLGANGRFDVSRLAGLLSDPLDLTRGKVPDKPVYHLVLRAADTDPDLPDSAWQDISTEVMHRLGLSERGDEENGVRWVAVQHGDNHVHIVAVLARMDGKPARLRGDWYTIGQTMTWAENKYSLKVVPRGSSRRSTAVRPACGELRKAERTGQPIARTELRRLVGEAASAAWSEEAFFAGLAARNVAFRLRYSTVNPGQVTGYSVALPGDLTAEGRPRMYGGARLDRNLSLPRIRARWATRTTSLGHRMNSATAKTVLRREVTAAAAAARTEEAFFKNLTARGIDVHLWYDPARPGRVVRYSAGLPGKAGRVGTPVRYASGTLSPALTLGKLRAHWRQGRPGAADPGLYDGAGRDTIYAHAASTAHWAAGEIRKNARCRADVALAAADIINAAADATGNFELRRAADGFLQTARTIRIPARHQSPAGQALRVCARLLNAASPPGARNMQTALQLAAALAGLADAIAQLKGGSSRTEAAATRQTAARIRPTIPGRARR